MTESTLEEMKQAVVEAHMQVQHGERGNNQTGIWDSKDRLLGCGFNEDDAWRDAYSKLPPMTSSSLYHAPKPVPEQKEIDHKFCSGHCCMPELYANGIKGSVSNLQPAPES